MKQQQQNSSDDLKAQVKEERSILPVLSLTRKERQKKMENELFGI